MSASVTLTISDVTWTEISQGVRYGFFTNHSDRTVIYRSSITDPGAGVTTGHRLHPGVNKGYVLSDSEKVWARSVHPLGTTVFLVVTPGYSTFTNSSSISKNFLEEVNQGNVEGAVLIHKFGSNPAVGTAHVDIWEGGPSAGSLQWMTAAETMDIISTDIIDDISTGVGARNVVITGLGDSFEELGETIALDTVVVTTVNAYRRILTARVDDVGTYTGTNTGDISITGSSSGTLQGFIVAQESRTSQTHYTIPAGKTGYLLRASITMNANKEVNVNIHNRPGADIVAAPFKASVHLHHWDGLATPIEERFLANHVLPEKTDVWFDGEVTSTPAGSIDVDYDILLIDN